MGSDAVFSMFGQNTRELGWFVKAGMTPAQALAVRHDDGGRVARAARIGSAASHRVTSPISSPSRATRCRTIDALFTGVRWVMKDGKVVVDKR